MRLRTPGSAPWSPAREVNVDRLDALRYWQLVQD
jgi:hypothetical protein